MALPPLYAGGVNVTLTWPLPAVAVPMTGESGTVISVNEAPTVRGSVREVIVHVVDVDESQPVKPAKNEPAVGVAVRTMPAPVVKSAVQVPGQVMPAGA